MGVKLAIGFAVVVALLIGTMLVLTNGQNTPVVVATASPVVTTPTATPTLVPTPSPSPTPTAEKILTDSYQAMQKVTSVKIVSSREGQPRRLQQFAGSGPAVRKLGPESSVAQYQRSRGTEGDGFISATTNLTEGTKFTVVRIDPKMWSKTDRVSSSGQVTSEGGWSANEQVRFQWPSQFFGKPLDPVLESRVFDLQAERVKLEGTEQKDGVTSYRITLTGRTVERGQESLKGVVTMLLWIDTVTLRWVRQDTTTKWEDTGEIFHSTSSYLDFDKDQGIKPPPGF